MKTLLLNIGLNTNDGQSLPLHTALLVCRNRFRIINLAVHASPNGDERCLVLEIDRESWDDLVDKVHDTCRLLWQDCIAVWDSGEGQLIGPCAKKWGTFNPEFFVTLSGETLTQASANNQPFYL